MDSKEDDAKSGSVKRIEVSDSEENKEKSETQEQLQPEEQFRPDTDASSVPEPEEQDVFEAASHATEPSKSSSDPSQYMPQLKPKKKWPKIVGWVLLGVLVLAAIAAGGYMLAKQHKSSKPQAKAGTSSQAASTPSTSSSTQQQSQNQSSTSTATKQYTSTNLKLSLSYPDGWTVVDSGGGKLTVTSPPTQITDASGQTQTGQVILQIENQDSADMSAFKTGSAVAVLPSQKITYSNPTSTQRASTYMSFLQYAATTTHGALDGVYITGNLGYQKDQTISEGDVAKIDPLVRVVFVKCSDSKCASTTPVSISSASWSGSSFSGPVEDMLKSLAFQ